MENLEHVMVLSLEMDMGWVLTFKIVALPYSEW